MDPILRTVDVYNQYVQEYMNKFMDLDLYKDTFDPLLEMLPQGGSVLELGCGPGNVIKHLRTQRPDLHFLGIDMAPEMIKAAKQQNPDAAFRLMDIRQAGQIGERFDAVMAPFCIPYLSHNDLARIFTAMSHLTVKGGTIYISCMEGAKERSGWEKTSFTGNSELHITYYQRSELELLMKEHGFAISRLYTKDYPETDGSVTTDLIYIAQKL